jgi:di/tricarboxylate transporter
MLVALIRDWGPPDAVILGTTILLATFRVISPEQAFSGFANPGVLTVGALFIVAAALRETGTLDYVGHRFLGRVKSERGALFWLASLVAPSSAFINNTPIVAMLTPVVLDWCRKRGVAPSKLLIPLSYLAILGGVCTLIGTSTNLVVHGLMLREELPGMGLFEIGKVGLVFAVVGVVYLLFIGHRLLPERKELMEQLGAARREYLVEMMVQPGCRLVGQSVEAAVLGLLQVFFLF